MLPEVIRAGRADLYSIFRTRAQDCAEALAIEDGSKKLTYGELLGRVDRLAAVFLARGVAPGDRIAILSHNRSEYLEVELAAAGIGAIVACLNWRLARDELQHCINLVEPVLATVEPDLSEAYRAAATTPCLAIGPDLEMAIAGAEPDPRTGTMVDDPEAGLTILYTSGTTGLPKGALISHRAHIARSMAFAAQLALDPSDGFIAWAPMFHMASTDHALATILRGGTVVMVDGLQPAVINEALSRHRIGWFVMMPGSLDAFVAERRANPLPVKGIKVCGAMADLVPPHQIAELTAFLDTPYLNSFGATETGLPPGTADLIAPGVTPDRLSKRISAFCEVRLVDPDDHEVPDGTPGEMGRKSGGLCRLQQGRAGCRSADEFVPGEAGRLQTAARVSFYRVRGFSQIDQRKGPAACPRSPARGLICAPARSSAHHARSSHKRHKRSGHCCDQLLILALHGIGTRFADGQGPSRLHHVSDEAKPFAVGRVEQIDLEFGCQNGRFRGHQRKGRVSAGAVERGRNDSGM